MFALRFYKNSLSLENEKIKTFNSNLILLTDAVNAVSKF